MIELAKVLAVQRKAHRLHTWSLVRGVVHKHPVNVVFVQVEVVDIVLPAAAQV